MIANKPSIEHLETDKTVKSFGLEPVGSVDSNDAIRTC